MPYPGDLESGDEPQLAREIYRASMSGLEPSLGGEQRFDLRVWTKLVDPRWPHKETLIAGLTAESCVLYANVLVQALPEGASFSETLRGGAALNGQYSTAQRAAGALSLGLIGARLGCPKAMPIAEALILRVSFTDEDEEVRVEAARALGVIGNPLAETPLIRALPDGDWKFRLAAIRALGQAGQARALDYLVDFYDHSESLNESRAALEALGALGGRLGGGARQRVYDLAMRVFLRSDGLQKGAAARALGRLGDRRALEMLIQVAMNGRGDLQSAAVEALGILGDAEAVPPLIFVLTTSDYPAKQDAVQALIRIGEASVSPALAALRHPEPTVRKGLAEMLGKVGARGAVGSLIGLLADPSVEVRQAAVNALGLIGDPDSSVALIGALGDVDAGVRKEAAMMLGGFKNPQAVGPLCLALWDPDMTVRWFAAYSLGLHADPRAAQPLIYALSDRAGNVAQTAADALTRLGDLAVPDLSRNLARRDDRFSAVITTILEEIDTPLAHEALATTTCSARGGPDVETPPN